MKKRWMVLSVLTLMFGLLLTGCMKSTEYFQVKADGSGSMKVEILYEKQAMLSYMKLMLVGMGEETVSDEAELLKQIENSGYTLVEKDGKEYFSAPDSEMSNMSFDSLSEFYQGQITGNMLRAAENDYVSLTETSVELGMPADAVNSDFWLNASGEDQVEDSSLLGDMGGLTEEQLKDSEICITVTFDTPIVKTSEGAVLSEDKKTVSFTVSLLAEKDSQFYAYCENDIAVEGIQSGRIYGRDISFDLPEGVDATVNGEVQTGTKVVSDQTRTYEVVLKKDGTQKTLFYEVDKKAPDIQNIKNNGVYGSKVKAGFCDRESGIAKITLDGKDITKELAFDFSENVVDSTDINFIYTYELSDLTEGKHTFTVQDKAGNQSTVSFQYDKTAPTVTGVKNNKTYKKSVTIKVKDKNGVKSITLNGKKIKSGKKVSKKGSYKLVVTDKAGNVKTIKFKIKK